MDPSLAGQRSGQLLILEPAGQHPTAHYHTIWRCICDCGTETTVMEQHLKRQGTRSCGCGGGKRRTPEQTKRNLLKKSKTNERGCWEWQGCILLNGYGITAYNRHRRLVHRLAAHLWNGFDLDSALFVCHHCDNPRCFNPSHLFIGTPQDNMQDAIKKGRLVPGKFYLAKTHCPQGHPYPPAARGGVRSCRPCTRKRGREYKRELRRKQGLPAKPERWKTEP